MKQRSNNDEIDIFPFLITLWKNKFTLFAITSAFVFIAFGINFLFSQTYQASVKISPPGQSLVFELAKFNFIQTKPWYGEYETIKIPLSQSVYEEFLQTLESDLLIEKFIKNYELDGKYEFIIEKSKGYSNNGRVLNFQYNDASLAAELANNFIQFAIEQYRAERLKSFIAIKKQYLDTQKSLKDALIAEQKINLNYHTSKLEEALKIAQKLKIEHPLNNYSSNKFDSSHEGDYVKELRYLYAQGINALNAEIENLQESKISSTKLLKLQNHILFINSLSLDTAKFSPVTITNFAKVTENPFNPNRNRVVILSAIIGFIVAVIFIFFRKEFINLKENF